MPKPHFHIDFIARHRNRILLEWLFWPEYLRNVLMGYESRIHAY